MINEFNNGSGIIVMIYTCMVKDFMVYFNSNDVYIYIYTYIYDERKAWAWTYWFAITWTLQIGKVKIVYISAKGIKWLRGRTQPDVC